MRSLGWLTLCCVLGVAPVLGEDWNQFLGPDGRASSEDRVPTQWSNQQNLVWKVDLPGAGSSSPVVVGDRVFVTCYSGTPPTTLMRYVVCLDRLSGKELWRSEIRGEVPEDRYQGYIMEHGYASNTPISDGESLFVFFGKSGVIAYDLDGKELWKREVGKLSSNREWGSAASLVLLDEMLIVNAAEEARAILALNKQDGSQIWKSEADALELAYGTPRIVTLDNDEREIVLSVPAEVWGMNPANGKLRWYAETALTGNVCPSLVVDGDTVYTFGGYRSSGSQAIRAGGRGNVTDDRTLWTSRSSSYVATPLLHDGKLYWIDDRGIAWCTSAKTGETIYRERVPNVGSGRPVYASPIRIGQNLYVVSRRNGTFVYPVGDRFNVAARNVLEGDDTDFNATPAVASGQLYLRSNRALYCIGAK